MSVKLLSESMDATITDVDQARIETILAFWFKKKELSAPQIDGRMDVWFGEDQALDQEIRNEFLRDVEEASSGRLDHWVKTPKGRLALILVLDQFRRNIYRGTPEAYSLDRKALKICVEGAISRGDQGLTPIQRVFFYMPLQHAESLKVQTRSVPIYKRLTEVVSPTYVETFLTVLQFAELHHDIIERFGRFPHRNAIIGRENTPEESEYLTGVAPALESAAG